MVATTDLIVDRLKELDSTLDVREGTALYEFLVKPLALVLSTLRSEIDEIKQFQSISTAETLPESELDLLASNFFITRNNGDRATTTVRIFVTEAADITLEVGAIFDSKTGQQFNTVLICNKVRVPESYVHWKQLLSASVSYACFLTA